MKCGFFIKRRLNKLRQRYHVKQFVVTLLGPRGLTPSYYLKLAPSVLFAERFTCSVRMNAHTVDALKCYVAITVKVA